MSLSDAGEESSVSGEGRVIVTFEYVDEVHTPADLMTRSDLVLFGRPVGGEVLLQDFPESGIQIIGQDFVATKPVKGESAAPFVTVIRTHSVDATVQEMPPFAHPLYLLALRSTEGSYDVPAWSTIAGPAGRIPFGPSASGELLSIVETQGNRIQAQLAGMTEQEVIEAIRG